MQKTHDALTKAREEAETNPSQENNIKLQQRKAKHLRTELECQRWREKTSSLNIEKDTTKLWNLTKALNDEESKGQKITLEDEGKTITGKAASKAVVKGYETESNTNIPLARKKRSKSRI